MENAEKSAEHLCMTHRLEREQESAAHQRELKECRTTLALEFTKQSEEQHRRFTKELQRMSADINELRKLQNEKQDALLKLYKKDRLQIWSLLINDQSSLEIGEAVTDSTDQHHLPHGNKHHLNANMDSEEDEMHLSKRFQVPNVVIPDGEASKQIKQKGKNAE